MTPGDVALLGRRRRGGRRRQRGGRRRLADLASRRCSRSATRASRQRHQHRRAVPRLPRQRPRRPAGAGGQGPRIRSLAARQRRRGGRRRGPAADHARRRLPAVVPVPHPAGLRAAAAQPRLAKACSRAAREGAAEHGLVLQATVLLAAVYGAYFGAGLGVLLLGLLGVFLVESLQRVNALKNVLSLVINTVALVAFGLFGPVAWDAVLVVAVASLVGGYVGARVARRIPAARAARARRRVRRGRRPRPAARLTRGRPRAGASPSTVVDVLSRETPPALVVDPGDRLVVRSLDASGYLSPQREPGDRPPRLLPDARGHCLTGPVEVRGAQPRRPAGRLPGAAAARRLGLDGGRLQGRRAGGAAGRRGRSPGRAAVGRRRRGRRRHQRPRPAGAPRPVPRCHRHASRRAGQPLHRAAAHARGRQRRLPRARRGLDAVPARDGPRGAAVPRATGTPRRATARSAARRWSAR